MSLKSTLILALGAAALVQAGAAHAAPSIEAGRRLAQRNCAQCHETGDAGVSPNAGAPVFGSLYRRYPAGALGEALKQGLLTRHPAMPKIRLRRGEIADLVAYLSSLSPSGTKGV